ncbi:MAG: hypothetical protein H6849_04880 [Alphaproteobacteria bacterium]|nr:MAG: hypothetical protein H6849_04880 [Alphaproteobacteria bacterium]
MTGTSYDRLTKHASGSFSEFFWLIIPLVLSNVSRGTMFLVDRLVLVNYSMESVNALTAAGTNFAVITLGIYGVVGISQVFAAQLNGARKYTQVASPIWQMIWLSLIINILTIPLGAFLPDYILAPLVREEGRIYYSWGMYFVFPMGVVVALNSFFTAIGRTGIVTFGAILANVINAGACVILALGCGGFVEPMGIKGAILSTIVAEFFEALVLLAIFFHPKFRKRYGTTQCFFRPKLFITCIKVGLPSSVMHMMELSAWGAVSYIIASMGFVHMSTFSVFHTLFVFAAHVIGGVERGVSSLVANALGSRELVYVKRALWNGILFMGLSVFFLIGPVALFPDFVIDRLVCENMNPMDYARIIEAVKVSLVLIGLYAFADGFGWIFAGVLTAAGDTRFLMIANTINVWIFGVLPIYFMNRYVYVAPEYTWVTQSGFVIANIIVFMWRFHQGIWRTSNLTKNMNS